MNDLKVILLIFMLAGHFAMAQSDNIPQPPPFSVGSLHRVKYNESTQKHELTTPSFGATRLTPDGRLGFGGSRFVLISPERYATTQTQQPTFILGPQNMDFISHQYSLSGNSRYPLLKSNELDDYNTLVALKKEATQSKNWSSYNSKVDSLKSQGKPFGQSGLFTCNRGKGARKCNESEGGDTKDCYDLTFMGIARFMSKQDGVEKNAFRIRSQDFTIVVGQPKSTTAKIVDLILNNGVKESQTLFVQDHDFVDPIRKDPHGSSIILEPASTDDGRLMIGRIGYRKILQGSQSPNPIDIFYAMAPKSGAPCDATNFNSLETPSYAFHDPLMKDTDNSVRYGFAIYQMRDGVGNKLGKFTTMGTYPWIDNKGDNFFFETVNSTLYEREVTGFDSQGRPQLGPMLSSRYPSKCVVGSFDFGSSTGKVSCNTNFPKAVSGVVRPEKTDMTRGVAVIGSWTKGKLMLLDGQINHIDFGLQSHVFQQRKIQLYDSADNTGEWVRVGAGRSSGEKYDSGQLFQEFKVTRNIDNKNVNINSVGANKNVINSLQNLLNGYKAFETSMPRDVVWLMNDNQGSAEVAFDDYISHRMYINAEMTGALEFRGVASQETSGDSRQTWVYYDGYKPIFNEKYINPDSGLQDIRIQNGVSNLGYGPPKYGLVKNGRLEPIAQGGIEGKGFWLNGTSTSLTFKTQKAIDNRSMYIGLFIAPYWNSGDNKGGSRHLLRFPDGSTLRVDATKIRMITSTGETVDTLFPIDQRLDNQTWTHLGLQLNKDHYSLSIYMNGMLLKKKVEFKSPIYQLSSVGDITIGGGVHQRGWIDNFKIMFGYVNVEQICNFAYGSVYAVKDGAPASYHDLAEDFPANKNQITKALLPDTATELEGLSFICKTDYSNHKGIYKAKKYKNNELISLRDELLLKDINKEDGKVRRTLIRPDFTANGFCLSCHTDNSLVRGLKIEALVSDTSYNCATKDSRRQPMQSPKRALFGNKHIDLKNSLVNRSGLDYNTNMGNIDFMEMYNAENGQNECY